MTTTAVAAGSTSKRNLSAALLALTSGALANSGDKHRAIVHGGLRFGHVLDPRTGWPVSQAQRSVTVLADSCSETGLPAKLALLNGADAEKFLRSEQVRAWVAR